MTDEALRQSSRTRGETLSGMPVLEEQRQLMPEWFVYILRSQTRRFIYVGSTRDLRRRLDEHNAGLVQSTKAYRPLAIVAYIAVQGEQKARELERYFKTGSGKAILKKRILTDEALLFGA